jgi:ethanolamine utilization microcompartment shell protein EutS
MEFTIIRSPEKGTLEIILERSNTKIDKTDLCTDTIGLVQGKVLDMILAADVAEKSANVTVCDIRGACPQNMTVLGVFGDTSSVETAVKNIKETVKSRKDRI